MFQKLHHLRAADRAGKQPRVEVPPRHPKSWERCLSISRPKTVVYVHGFENKDTLGNTLGGIWYYRVYRLWHCAGPAVPPMLFEHLDEGLRGAPLSEAKALVREDVAAINVRAFEKLRQEREA